MADHDFHAMDVLFPDAVELDPTASAGELECTPLGITDGSQVLQHDGYDVRIYEEALATYEKLAAAVDAARQRLVTAPALFRDLFWSFYKHLPAANPVVPVTPAHHVNEDIMQQMMSTVEWSTVREAGTIGDVLASAMATLGVAGKALQALDTATVDRINRLHELESGATALFEQADALDELAAQASADRMPELHVAAQQARADALAAQAAADEETRALAEDAEDREDHVRRAARAGLHAAETEISDMEAMVSAFGGHDHGRSSGDNPMMISPKEKLELARRVGQSSRLKQIAAACGRLSRIALQVQRNRVQHPPDEVTSITFGQELSRLLPSELALLADPDLEELFLLKLAESRLMQYELIGNERQGQGPIILALDSSGSMTQQIQGISKEVWSKAVMLAMLSIARLQKRDMAVIHFGTQIKTWMFPQGRGSYLEVTDCAAYFMSAGNENYPLWMEEALRIVEDARFDRADVICLADGLSTIPTADREAWQRRRQARSMRCFGMLIGTHDGAGVLASIADVLFTLDDLHDDIAVLETIFAV